MSFSSAERRKASMVGHLERSEDGATWTGHISGLCGDTILLTGRVEQFMGKPRLAILARHGQTADQKRLRREAEQNG